MDAKSSIGSGNITEVYTRSSGEMGWRGGGGEDRTSSYVQGSQSLSAVFSVPPPSLCMKAVSSTGKVQQFPLV